MTAIQAAIQAGMRSTPWPFLKMGQRVRIEQGPLCGIEGILVGFRGRERLVLSVSLLQSSIAVQIEAGWVRPLRPEKVPVNEMVSSSGPSPHSGLTPVFRRSRIKEGLSA
jgi:hypothetical protein